MRAVASGFALAGGDRYSKLSLRGTGLPLVIALAGGYAATPRRTAELTSRVT